MHSILRHILCGTAMALILGGAPSLVRGQVTVAPQAAASGVVPASTSEHVASFTVTGSGHVYLDCWGTGGITCSVKAEMDLSGTTEVEVAFSTSARQGTGYLFLRSTQYERGVCDSCGKHVDIGSRIFTVDPLPPTAGRD